MSHFQPKAVRVQGSSMFQSHERTANEGTWPSVTQAAEMLERGERLREDAGVYDTRDRAGIVL
ncbi:uncharacterized protein LACBIDRAFT_304307 [Laccaria bicolor S238N-H82]|uniref:Predicted protein n=1 Tax=Laccaria bicolor (strain S238N-H82 / ATCC MYA-4686) TaxID=486041 RepID=B0DLC1_LACBS|nr:uncharacterized protein LACBIDRAFT_304307 [Laccaria bicolor S238N-H82]EDR04625.1 predicted protein [Laccaria bicolor S238N-H82]|eukprot:XP_001884797.1 predicted protein [Laccaria bicolor S238N-H82]